MYWSKPKTKYLKIPITLIIVTKVNFNNVKFKEIKVTSECLFVSPYSSVELFPQIDSYCKKG